MNLDVSLLLASILFTILLAAVGVEMANAPPTSNKARWTYRASFIIFGVLLIGTTYWQGKRNTEEQNRIRVEAQVQQRDLKENFHSDLEKELTKQRAELAVSLTLQAKTPAERNFVAKVKDQIPPSPAQIQIDARGLTRECAERFSSSVNLLKWCSQIGGNCPVGTQEWDKFKTDYNKTLKGRLLSMHRLLESRLNYMPPRGIDAEQAFNMPTLVPEDILNQLKDLFILLNELEKENGLPLTKWE